MRLAWLFGLALLAIILTGSSCFVVNEWEQAIVLQFGKPVRDPITTPGIHFKLPFIQQVKFFEKRLLQWDGYPNIIPTRDSKFIYVDVFARWRISDVLKFYKSVNDETEAQSRLDDILDGLVRDYISKHTILEVVRSSNRDLPSFFEENEEKDTEHKKTNFEGMRLKIRDQILKSAKEKLKRLDLGIEITDIEIKRIDYSDKVTNKVYDRMISAQMRIAEKYKALGRGKMEEITGKIDKMRKEILSKAYKQAQTIKGRADAEATRIYAEAYKKDPDFFRFKTALDTYEKSIKSDSTLILTTDSDLFKLIKHSR